MKILWIFFGGHHIIRLYLGSFLCILESKSMSRDRMGNIFWVDKISNILLGCLKFLIFLGGER